MRGFWWWERDTEVLKQIALYREERRREKQDRREARREQRDYLAIVIALFAAGFTCWQAWEAHETRKDTQVQFEQAQERADRHAEQGRKDAKEAVDAQTKLAEHSAEQAKRSADAASTANKIAVAAMRQGQRPWVGPDIALPVKTGPVTIDQKGISLTFYQMTARSFGSYGANNVQFHAELMVAQDISTIWDREKGVCSFTTQNAKLGRTLFPGQESIMTNAWPAFATSAIRNLRANPPQKEFQVYLLTCIGYRDQFGESGTPHHTGTIFRRASTADGESVVFELTPSTTIPGEWREWYSSLD